MIDYHKFWKEQGPQNHLPNIPKAMTPFETSVRSIIQDPIDIAKVLYDVDRIAREACDLEKLNWVQCFCVAAMAGAKTGVVLNKNTDGVTVLTFTNEQFGLIRWDKKWVTYVIRQNSTPCYNYPELFPLCSGFIIPIECVLVEAKEEISKPNDLHLMAAFSSSMENDATKTNEDQFHPEMDETTTALLTAAIEDAKKRSENEQALPLSEWIPRERTPRPGDGDEHQRIVIKTAENSLLFWRSNDQLPLNVVAWHPLPKPITQ
jgi:hypothetical protein